MLDIDTRRRIDTARDILVGKVPDPKSQVEQITIAMIYKFMDDMDAESEEFGGQRKFFAGDFARYGWAKLMHSGLGGSEVLNLYSEAIVRMPENPGIPPLFRDIFKNAYLPYRDPETLRAFLKVIDGFTYEHSERLGDAFEYLLSVLGSQGDAGQFRTPRHIIDFIVEIVDPKKTEAVLDPACGTAGFLISSYKHILGANTDDRGNSTLTPDERGRLAQSFRGYDISPDMVRLSLVNMYLHGFVDPHIHEYDTLTSQERWNEYADVILANPPFMSPKGGIKPHNRFSVQSKRSEVLFVDYIAEHLTSSGRAGVIVPEGVIFQSQSAYVKLRKMLVNEYLVAVISLPAGVFNPYSGVKTSVLILDRSMAKKVNCIAFFQIRNDGFDLGAQRRPIDRDDLPLALSEIQEYLHRVGSRQTTDDFHPESGFIVAKQKIAARGDYNLSCERYRENQAHSSDYPLVPIGQVCDLIGGATPSRESESYWRDGSVKWISSKHIDERGHITGYELISKKAVEETSTRIAPRDSTIIITRVSVGKYGLADDDYAINQDLTALVPKDPGRLSPGFIYAIAPKIAELVERYAEGIGVRGVTRGFLAELLIPLPSLDIQKQIASEVEHCQRVIDGCLAAVGHYKPHLQVSPEWPSVPIGELAETCFLGLDRNKAEQGSMNPVPYIRMSNITQDGELDLTDLAYINASSTEIARCSLHDGDYIYNTRNSSKLVGKSAVFHGESGKYLFNNNILAIRFGAHVLPDFVNMIMSSDYGKERIRAQIDGTTSVAALYQKNYLAIEIPLAPLEVQKSIVSEAKEEKALVASCKELANRLSRRVKATLDRVWNGS